MPHAQISTLLVAAYLANILAAMPHAHEGDGKDTAPHQSQRPHVHITWFGPSAPSAADKHQHHHHHRHQHGHHHHSGKAHHHKSAPAPGDKADTRHDCNAIFFHPAAGGPSLTQTQKTLTPTDNGPGGLLPLESLCPAFVDTAGVSSLSGESTPGRPLYLMLRALRI